MWDKGTYINLLKGGVHSVVLHHVFLNCHSHAGDSEERFGAWSTEGCREVVRDGNRRVCECSQLAHFGILFVSLDSHKVHMV